MKKFYIILVLFLLLLGGIWSLYHFSSIFYPKISLSILQINRIGGDEASLKIQVDLKNRSPLSLSFKDFNFSVKAEDKVLMETASEVPVSLKAFRQSSFTVPIKVKLAEIKALNLKKTLAKEDSCLYQYRLEIINERNFFLPDTVLIEGEELLPLYQLPEVMLTKLEPLELLPKEGPKFNLSLAIVNKNVAPLIIRNPGYAVTFEGEDVLLEGRYPEDLVIEGKTTKTLVLPVQMDRQTILKHAPKLLFDKEDLDVKLIFNGNVQTNSKIISGCKLVVEVKGNFKELTTKKN